MVLLNISFFFLVTCFTTITTADARAINPPSKPPTTSSPNTVSVDLGVKIGIEKRNAQSLTLPNGVANIQLYRKQTDLSLGKIARGIKSFQLNTGRPLSKAVEELGVGVVAPLLHPLLHLLDSALDSAPPPPPPPPPPPNPEGRTGSDPLVDDSNVLWHGTIQVGTPPVNFTVDFDTGSSDLFLPGPSCTGCAGHTIFNPTNSTTSVSLQKNFTLSYGDGSSVSGVQFNDTIAFSGLSSSNQTVGVASVYSGFSTDSFPPDGLLGMGFRAISVYPANPFFQNLVEQDALNSSRFAFKLSQNVGESELTLGGVNQALFDPESLVFTNVTVPGYWQVVIDSVNVDGSPAASKISGIIDSGTTLIIGDPTTVKQIYDLIPGAQDASSTLGAGLFTYPCNSTSVLSLSFSGRAFNISPDVFNLGTVSSTSTDCVGGLIAGDTGVGWIVGDVFLMNTYTIFDFGNRRVGFANLK